MSNEYYDHTTAPPPGSFGSSATVRQEFDRVEQGFDKLPTLAGNASRYVLVNSSGTALAASSLLTELGGALVLSGGKVTGAGVDAMFAAAPAIGSTTPSSGVFTTLRATSAIPTGDATDRVATTAFVASVALGSSLPGQAGQDGNLIKTRGGSAFWSKGELEPEIVSGTAVTAAHGKHYFLTNAAKTTVTAMGSPSAYDAFRVTPANGRRDNEIAWNGNKHENISDATMVIADPSVLSVFINAGFGFKVLR